MLILWLALLGLAGAFVLGALAFSKQEIESEKVGLKQRLDALSAKRVEEVKPGSEFLKKDAAKEDLKKMLGHLTGEAYIQRTEKMLAQADIPIRVSEFLMLRVVLICGGAALALRFSGNYMVAAGTGALMALIHLPLIALKRSMRIGRFTNQLADFLSLICNSLRAGQTFMQGVDMACKESPEPIATEFRQLLRETNLGMPMEESFGNMYLRVPSDDLRIALSAFSIQRQVGGNLADILDQVSKTIRERIKIQGQIKVLTTQGKFSGAIVGLMPIALLGIFSIIAPDKVDKLTHTQIGNYLLYGAGFLQLMGVVTIYNICQIEV